MPLETLRAGDDRVAPIVCVHQVTGRLDPYRPLAQALDWPGPVLGLSAPEPTEDDSLTTLANRHTDTLNLARPILLLGWQLGGVIAAELSRTIVARGGEVSFLGILDSRAPHPEMRTRPIDRDALAKNFVWHARMSRELEPAPAPSSSATDLLAALRAIGAADEMGIADEAELERRLRSFSSLIRGFYHHESQPVPVTIHLFESADEHPTHRKPATLGWDDLAPRVEKHPVDGTHFTLMAPQRVAALAQTISSYLPR